MGQTARFQEILRRLAIIDERVFADHAGLYLAQPESQLLDPKTAALVQVAAMVAMGAPAVCLEWSTSRALAAGATEEEITDVLLAVVPAAGLSRGRRRRHRRGGGARLRRRGRARPPR